MAEHREHLRLIVEDSIVKSIEDYLGARVEPWMVEPCDTGRLDMIRRQWRDQGQ